MSRSLTLAFALVVAAPAAPGAASPAPSNPQLAIGLDQHPGAPVPANLAFTDTAGHRVSLGQYFDGHRPVVLVLAYAHCRMLCSVVLHAVADAVVASKLAIGVDYLPVIVSIDPHETRATSKHRQDQLLGQIHHAGEPALWPYLSGDEATIEALAAALGFHYVWDPKTQQFAHPAVVFMLTPDGRIAEYLRGVKYADFDDAVTRAKSGSVTSSISSDILRCFHFDPSLRRYGRQMQLFFRLGAATVLFALGGMVGFLVLLRRRRNRRRP